MPAAAPGVVQTSELVWAMADGAGLGKALEDVSSTDRTVANRLPLSQSRNRQSPLPWGWRV